MNCNEAVSEIIGAIALIGIIVAMFGIYSSIYLPMIKPQSIPQVKISMACSDTIDIFDTEFPCTQGSFSCHPSSDPFNYKMCEENCKYKKYADKEQFYADDSSVDILRCMEHCIAPMCSNLKECNVIYFCHNGGDTLDIDLMKIIINEEKFDGTKFEKKLYNNDSFFGYDKWSDKYFSIGSSLRIQNPPKPVDKVMIIYTTPSGSDVTLVLNQFGTDVI